LHYKNISRLYYPNLHVPDGTGDLLSLGWLSGSHALSWNSGLLRNGTDSLGLTGDWLLSEASILMPSDGGSGYRSGGLIVSGSGDTGSGLGLGVERSKLAFSFS